MQKAKLIIVFFLFQVSVIDHRYFGAVNCHYASNSLLRYVSEHVRNVVDMDT